MATGLSAYLCNSFLDALGNATAYSVTNVYVKLHVSDPGANGTSGAATETTRKVVSFGAASAGAITSDGRISQVRKTQHTSPLGTMSVPATSCSQARSQATLIQLVTLTQSHLGISVRP
jgi:hypothetical protein